MLAGLASLARNVPKIARIFSGAKPRWTNIDTADKLKALRNVEKYKGDGPIYRGTTLKKTTERHPHPQMESLKNDEVYFSRSPDEATSFARWDDPSQTLDDPGVILRLPDETNTRPGAIPSHRIALNEKGANIPLLMNIVRRLQTMGWSDAHIFKYIRQLFKDPRPKKIFNRGGIVSLVL